jgi:hypothetical protein
MALEGNVPDLYDPAFAEMQVRVRDEPAVDDAGRLLDAWGRKAERLGWSPAAMLDAIGLV